MEGETEVTVYQYATLAIAQVRQLIVTAYLKPTLLSTRTIVLTASGIAPEAQHALLKILEEPPLTTKFVLWLSPGAVLLPTLRSRLAEFVLPDGTTAEVSDFAAFSDFLVTNYANRLELIASATKNKNLVLLAELARGLGRYVANNNHITTAKRSQLVWCLSQLEFRGSSKKMLWEEIALHLPVEARP